jgi:hypothetical protein
MKEQKLTLEIPYYSQSVQGLIWDFQTYCRANKIAHTVKVSSEFRKQIMGKGGFAKFTVKEKFFLIDVQDDPLNYPFFKDYDFIFKRSYSNKIQYFDNVFPFGFRFDVFDGLHSVFLSNVKSFLFNWKHRRELIRTAVNILGFDFAGFNNLSRRYKKLNWDGLNSKIFDTKKILFSTRLFLDLERGLKITEERKQINELLKSRNDVILNTISPLDQSKFLKATSSCNIVVINNGLYDVPGIRFPELLLLGKVVVTLPLNVQVPGLIDGIHYISTTMEDLNNCLDNLSVDKIKKIQANGREYAQNYFGPGKRMEYILGLI